MSNAEIAIKMMSNVEMAIFMTCCVGALTGLVCVSYMLITVLKRKDDE